MSNFEHPPITIEQQERVLAVIEQVHEKLESAAQSNTTHAFNLGCSVGLLPAALIIGVAFLITKGSWIAAVITALLMAIALLGFASLVANITRVNIIENTYKNEALPQIEAVLQELDISRTDFDCLANQYLPEGAYLRKYLSIPVAMEKITEPN
jgi:hypothetical protein